MPKSDGVLALGDVVEVLCVRVESTELILSYECPWKVDLDS